jgi:hypothetical protein
MKQDMRRFSHPKLVEVNPKFAIRPSEVVDEIDATDAKVVDARGVKDAEDRLAVAH